MSLANMVRIDEGALICDLAETYHIFCMREYPASLVATLAAGLRPNSRIAMRISGQRYDSQTMLLAGIADRLSTLIYMQTKDAKHGRNKPQSIVEAMLKKPKEKPTGFATAEAFERRRAQLIKEINHGK